MDPNEILNGPQKDGEWLSQADPDDPSSTAENTYVYVRRYADGRVVTQYFRRNSGGGPVGADGKPGDAVVREKTTTDPTQAAKWEKQKAEAQRQQDQSERKVKRKYTGTDPQTGRPAIVTEYETGEPSYEEIKPDATQTQAPKEEKNPNDPTRMRRWNPQSKQWEDAGPNQEEIDRREKEKATANRPIVTIREDGKGGLVAISTYPDGRAPTTTPVPGVQGKPDQITHQGVVYERQPDGTYKPAAGIPVPGQARKNIDQFQPDYTQPDLGLGAWAAAQRKKIGLPPDQGGITQADYDAATKEAHDSASVTITNITNSQNVVRQQAIDNQSRQDTQAGYAENDLGRKQRVYEQIWRYVDPNTDSIRPWLPDSAEAQAMRQRYAGMATPMPSLHPMFQNLATNAGVIKPTGAPTGGTPPPPSSVPPAVTEAAAAPPVRDDYRTNPGQAPAPAAAPPVRDDYRTNPGQAPAPAAAPAPTMTPDAFVPAPAPAPAQTPAMTPDAFAPTPSAATGDPFVGGRVLPQPEPAAPAVEVPPLETPTPWSADPNAAPDGAAFPPLPIVPRAGTEAGGNVQKVMPQPVTGWAMQALGTPPGTVAVQPQQAQAVNPALQAAQQGAAQPLFDPYDTAGRLARMGVPQNAIAQAMREMGMLQEEAVA